MLLLVQMGSMLNFILPLGPGLLMMWLIWLNPFSLLQSFLIILVKQTLLLFPRNWFLLSLLITVLLVFATLSTKSFPNALQIGLSHTCLTTLTLLNKLSLKVAALAITLLLLKKSLIPFNFHLG